MVDQQVSVKWEPREIDLGVISWRDNPHFEFVYTGEEFIKSINATCPCIKISLTSNNKYNLIIQGNWKPKKPDEKFYISSKKIVVRYGNQDRDELIVKAVITE